DAGAMLALAERDVTAVAEGAMRRAVGAAVIALGGKAAHDVAAVALAEDGIEPAASAVHARAGERLALAGEGAGDRAHVADEHAHAVELGAIDREKLGLLDLVFVHEHGATTARHRIDHEAAVRLRDRVDARGGGAERDGGSDDRIAPVGDHAADA